MNGVFGGNLFFQGKEEVPPEPPSRRKPHFAVRPSEGGAGGGGVGEETAGKMMGILTKINTIY